MNPQIPKEDPRQLVEQMKQQAERRGLVDIRRPVEGHKPIRAIRSPNRCAVSSREPRVIAPRVYNHPVADQLRFRLVDPSFSGSARRLRFGDE